MIIFMDYLTSPLIYIKFDNITNNCLALPHALIIFMPHLTPAKY